MPNNVFQPLPNNQPIVNPDGTPTTAFIRWAQQRQNFLQEATDGVDDLDGDIGSIDSQIAAINAELDTKPGEAPEDGVLYGRQDAAWEPVYPDFTGNDGKFLKLVAGEPEWAAGGGGGGATPPTLRQIATRRNDGIIAFATPPLPGSLIVYVYAGFAQSLPSMEIGGFAIIGGWNSDNNNGVRASFTFYEAGGATSWNNSASDNQFAAIYEFTGATGVKPVAGYYAPIVAANKTKLGGNGGPGVHRIFVIETDGVGTSTCDKTGQPGFFMDYTTTLDGSNHSGCIIRTTPDFTDGAFTVTNTGSNYNGAVYGMFDVVGA